MSAELFFIYDSHCPWSYATTELVENIVNTLPQVHLHLMHCAYFDGDSKVSIETIKRVESLSNIQFSQTYLKTLAQEKDSTLAANLLTWVQHKSAKHGLALLKSMQKAHFEQANPLTDKEDVIDLINEHKLSPPAKSLQCEKFTKDTEYALHEISELQEIIGTTAIPALLLAKGEQLILLNHNLYLTEPMKIVDAVKIELNK